MSSTEALPSNSLRTLASFRAVSSSSTSTVIHYDLSQTLADNKPDERRKSNSFLSLFRKPLHPTIPTNTESRRRRTLSSITGFFHKLNPRNKPEKGHTIRRSPIQDAIAQLGTPFDVVIEVPVVPTESMIPITSEPMVPVRSEPKITVIKKSLIPVLKRKPVDSQTSSATQSADFKDNSMIPVLKRKPVGVKTCDNKITQCSQRKALLKRGDYLGVQGFNPRTGVRDPSEETMSKPSTQIQSPQRKALIESGDYLGVQGFNPRTGVRDPSEETMSKPSTQTQSPQRKALIESGDYLGVQGFNPRTGGRDPGEETMGKPSTQTITESSQRKALLESGDYLGVQGFNLRTGVHNPSEETTGKPSTQTKDLSQRTIETLQAVTATIQQKEAEEKRRKRQGFRDMQYRTGAKRSGAKQNGSKQRWVAKPDAWVSINTNSSTEEPTTQRESDTDTIINHVVDTTQRESADTVIHHDVENPGEPESSNFLEMPGQVGTYTYTTTTIGGSTGVSYEGGFGLTSMLLGFFAAVVIMLGWGR